MTTQDQPSPNDNTPKGDSRTAQPSDALDARVLATYMNFCRKRLFRRRANWAGVFVLCLLAAVFASTQFAAHQQPRAITAQDQRIDSALLPVFSGIGYTTYRDLRGFQIANQGKISIVRRPE